jgi:hypothetical protein
MKRVLILIALGLFLCSTTSAFQGGGGEPTKTKSTLKKPVSKNPVAKKPKTSPSANSGTDESTYWESIRNSTDPADFRAYLKEYPNGKHVTLATSRLTNLEAAAREAAADEERKRQAAAKEEADRKEEETRKAEARRKEIEALKRPGSYETPTYRVTVESLERNANNYTATLVFENLSDEMIKIAWQEKSNLVPDATGPYLIDESGGKYFAKGPDSGNILQDTMKFLWVPLTEILPKTKLTSRFLFIGNGNGSIFTLRAKELKGLGPEDPVTIEGLKIGNQTELPFPTPSVSPAPIEETSINAPVTAPTTAAANARSLETLSSAVDGFLALLKDGRQFEAQDRLSSDYKKWVIGVGGIKNENLKSYYRSDNIRAYVVVKLDVSSDSARAQVRITTKDGSTHDDYIELVYESGKWLVAQF